MNLLLLAALLSAATVADPARLVVHASGSEPQAGQLATLAADGRVALSAPDAVVPPGTLVSLRRADRTLPAWPRSPQIVLANGDRIACTVAGGDGAKLRVVPSTGETWSVPLSALAALWVTPPPADTPADPSRYSWRTPAQRGDVVMLGNGDTITGTVEAVSADGASLRFAAERGQPGRTVALATVAAIAFDPTLARARKPKGPYYRVVARNGSRVSAASLTSDGAEFAGTTLFGAKFRLPVAEVIAVNVLQGKAAYLSDLKPEKIVSEWYDGTAWPPMADRTAKGFPLRLAGPTGGWFDKGVGTHPRTVLTYNLGGKYKRFEACIGLDPATGRRGAAIVRVLVDGKEHPVGPPTGLTAAVPPVEVRVDVTRAKDLTLVVDYGPAGDVQADVNWADARLVE